MNIFPAIDLMDGQAVRLLKGDYNQKTVYNSDPLQVVRDFKAKGAKYLHLVDLDGAKSGTTPNMDTIRAIVAEGGLFVEVGGGIRSMETVEAYLQGGVDRVIIGTAAVTDPAFLQTAVAKYPEQVAVGIDVKDGKVAIKGWLETSEYTLFDFCRKMKEVGVGTIICTDISKDGAMQGTNTEMYRKLQQMFDMQITASGGVSSIEDIRRLRALDLYGAIIGKAYYIGAVDLAQAIEEAK